MPNYEILNGYCNLRKKTAVFPATYVAEPGHATKMLTEINDCFSKDPRCKELGCKYTGGDKEPPIDLT